VAFSDHIPLLLGFQTDLGASEKGTSIPRWLAASVEFESALRLIWKPPINNKCPFRTLSKFKAAQYKAAAIARKTRIEDGSLLLAFSHHFSLLRLISRTKCVFPSSFLSPSLADLIEVRGARFFDCGLEQALCELRLKLDSGVAESPPTPHPSRAIKDKLPISRAGTPHLRLREDDTPCFDARGKTLIASDYWAKIWAPRPSCNSPYLDRSLRLDLLSSYDKRIDASLIDDLTWKAW
jgi:hypothetical protein